MQKKIEIHVCKSLVFYFLKNIEKHEKRMDLLKARILYFYGKSQLKYAELY